MDTSRQPGTPAGADAYRDAFPYYGLPRTILLPDEVPMEPAPVLRITDTTFRDGQQARAAYSAEQVAHLFDFLHRLDNGVGLIRKSEFFVYTRLQRAIVDLCRSRGYRYPEVTAWIRANAEDLAIVRELGLAETGILTSVSDHHIYTKLGLDRVRACEAYLSVVDQALAAGIRPRCHFEDVTRADVHGFVVPFARALVRRGEEAGLQISIRLCDTMGVAAPWAAVALPRGLPRLVHALVHDAGVAPSQLEWHGHNDFFKGHACAATAWLYGCAAINATLLGTGERTGNTPLEAAVVEYVGLTGEQGLNLPVLVEIASYMREICAVPVPANYPMLGEECFTTRAGVHIDGLLKDPETYMSFDPQQVLGRPIRAVISDQSGAAGVAWWLNTRLGGKDSQRIAKTDPAVQAMHARLMAHYAEGGSPEPTDDELLAIARQVLPADIVLDA